MEKDIEKYFADIDAKGFDKITIEEIESLSETKNDDLEDYISLDDLKKLRLQKQ